MLDLIEGQVERREFSKGIEALDVRNKIVIEVDFCKARCEFFWYRNTFYSVLAKAETLRC